MQRFNVTGMSCAACAARVEKAVSGVSGVSSCAVNLLTNSMNVEGSFAVEDVISAVGKAGYGASLGGEDVKKRERADDDGRKILKRLCVSIVLLAVLMYFSMGAMMFNFPLPKFFEHNCVAVGLVQMILAAAIMVINGKFFESGFKALIKRAPNMDTLVAIGSGASFVWSVYALFMMTEAVALGNNAEAMALMDEFYFESAAMILTLITVGKMLEARSKGKTTDALKSLMKLAPETALIEEDGEQRLVPVKDVKPGDVFVVKPGDSIPVDGIVESGSGAVNEAALTGESMPVDKSVGDLVSAGTMNTFGYLKCRATNVGENTALAKIIKMVSDASAGKAPIAKLADKVSGVFVPAVITVAVITMVLWLIIGKSFDFALARAISVLVISCPCALGLATPVAIMVGNGVGAKNGILFKTAETLENAGKIKSVALDKTGTVTLGEPTVTDVIPFGECDLAELLRIGISVEAKSEHPLARAVMAYGKEKNVNPEDVTEFSALPGSGVKAELKDDVIFAGNLNLAKKKAKIDGTAEKTAEKLSEEGKTPLFFVKNGTLIGIIAARDAIKPEAREAVLELEKMGIAVTMLTGDNEKTAKAIADLAGIENVIAGVMPEGKAEAVKALSQNGKVAMVGDGINDAPALTGSDVGIAIGAGTDVAIDAADVVLMKSTLTDVPAAITLSRAVVKNIKENLFWAFVYNAIGIPIAAGCFSSFGLTLNPMIGAAAMSLSSVSVVSNALRLNRVKIYSKKDGGHAIELKVKGMMCEHCEARVTKAVGALYNAASVKASHKKGTVTVISGEVLDEEKITAAITAAGYKLINIKEKKL